MPGQTISQNNPDHYPIIQSLQTAEANYRSLIDEYTTKYAEFADIVNTDMSNNVQLDLSNAHVNELKKLVNSMEVELETMKTNLKDAYSKGLHNQDLSAEASNALHIQSSLIDERVKQFNEARDTIAHLIGEEKDFRRAAVRNQYSYYVYFIFAIALIASIVSLLMGGSLPFSIFVILLVLGFFVGWETYKGIIVKSANKVSDELNLDINPMRFKGTFNLLT